MQSRRRVCLGMMVMGLVAGASVRGETLAERVPADAMVFMEWQGLDALGPTYEASHLKAFLTALNLPQYLRETLADHLNRPGDAPQAENAQREKLVADYVALLVKAPGGLYVGSPAEAQHPIPQVALVSHVGKAAAVVMAGKLNAVLNHDSQMQVPHGAIAAGDFLVVYAGNHDIDARLTGNVQSDNLAAAPAYQNALGQLGPAGKDPAILLYADAQAALRWGQAAIGASTNPNAANIAQMYPTIVEALGVNHFTQGAWAGKFDGADWQAASFIGMDERRTGVLAFFDNKPLSDAAYKMIPATAMVAGVVRGDGERLLADVADAAGHMGDRAAQRVETTFQQIYAITGVDFKRELLPAFGDEFIYYSSPDASGDSLRGFTVVNRLKDAAKAESAMNAAESFINLLILQRVPQASMQFRSQALAAPWEAVTAHVIQLEKIAPAWAIHKGTFYFSLSLAGLQSAIQFSGGDGQKATLLQNPAFVALGKRVMAAGAPPAPAQGAAGISGFSFGDLPRSVPQTYDVIGQVLSEVRREDPGMPHPYVLPSLERIAPTVGPVLRESWTDAAGYHMREAGPFPLAWQFGPEQFFPIRLIQMFRAAGPGGPRPMGGPGGPGLP